MQPSDNASIPPRVFEGNSPVPTYRHIAKQRMFQPGMVSLFVGIVHCVVALVNLLSPSFDSVPPDAAPAMSLNNFLLLTLLNGGYLLIGVACIYGGAQMLRVRQYAACIVAASALAMPFPVLLCAFPFNLAGIPIAIWVFSNLLHDKTKAAFGEPDECD